MATKILTVTLNPAIDQTIMVGALKPGHVHRADSVWRHAGGKGVNVASCLADWGGLAITAAGLIGGDNAAVFESLCVDKGIRDAFVRLPGETRINIKLAHDGETTDINLPGLGVTDAALGELRGVIDDLTKTDTILLLAGSLPPRVSDSIYAELIASSRQSGARILLDTSGAPLAAALAGDAMPACIKPNRAELEELTGEALRTEADLVTAAEILRARGVKLVVVSLGAEGALFVGERVLHASLPAIRTPSTVGAGDAMVAGIIAAMAANADCLATARLATAFAAAKLGQAGPNLPARDIIEALAKQVKIRIFEETKK